ncbi:MAG TPA: two-component system response regulator [Nitrospiraceae bacterium]|nr:two-component system response regulator [Nitrospiraceae bacterium]
MDILIVDDDPYIQRSLSFVLRKEGLIVELASDGEEAIKKARVFRPKIIFLDLMMPKINGFNACRTIKSDQELKGSYVIILTAKGQEVDKELGFKAGANEFITKPFSPKEIIVRVREVLGGFK